MLLRTQRVAAAVTRSALTRSAACTQVAQQVSNAVTPRVWLARHSASAAAATATRTVAPRPVTADENLPLKAPAGKVGRDGRYFWLTPEQIKRYHDEGYMKLENFLSEDELKPIEEVYDRFMQREIEVPGKDLCDMSGDFGVPFEQWNLINAMLPTTYYPSLAKNIYEQRASHVVHQLFPDTKFGLDYDQLLAKKPSKSKAVFAWHSDMAYWPQTPDTRTATFSLALDATTEANGCLRFVPGSHRAERIRVHKPVNADRTKAHAVACVVGEDEVVTHEPVGRGGVTIHNELVVHGSGGNQTQGWRRTYVAAFRTLDTIAMERKAGFTHSHNDSVNWDTFNKWQEA